MVLAGLDRGFNYTKMAIAMRNIREGASFIATNTDATLATERGFKPGGGAIVRAIEVASGKRATVVGKPSKIMGEFILRELEIEPSDSLLIGDRLETDIAFGRALGMHTALVLTGVSTEEEVEKSDVKPDYILESL